MNRFLRAGSCPCVRIHHPRRTRRLLRRAHATTTGVIIADTSVITNLANIRHLWLQRIYGVVFVPPRVRRAWWIRRVTVQDRRAWRVLQQQHPKLARGEAECIVRACEHRAQVVLIDETVGRRVAAQNGSTPTGVLGILIQAKRRKLIRRVQPLMDQLIDDHQFYVAPALYAEVLLRAGE